MKQSVTLLIIFFTLSFCKAEAQRLEYDKDSTKHLSFSLKKFNDNIFSSLKDSAVGWAYIILKNGKQVFSNNGGYKITPIDCKDGKGLPFEPETRIHVASLSKTITALAIAKLIELKKIAWESKAKNFLPSYWKFHSLFEQLTIRQLVEMKSGMDGPLDALSSSTDSLQLLIERGPNQSKIGVFNYQNTSYGLLRIIIAYATGYKELSSALNSNILSVATSNLYKNFVNEYLFKPSGINEADCRIRDYNPAFYYPFPYNNEHGELTGTGGIIPDGDLSEYAGGFGWYLSVMDAAKLMNSVLYKKTILRQQTIADLFGLGFPFKIRKGTYASYFGSGGDWGHPVKPKGWRGIHAYYYCFPDNIIVTIFMNSGEGSPTGRILRAYNNSFNIL
jgi:CubicO group peptidase (beta-lactamase class C family)